MDLPVKCVMDSPGWRFQGWGWMTIQSFNVWSTVKGQPCLSTRHLLTLSTRERKHMGAHGRGKLCMFCPLSDVITSHSWCGEVAAVLL